MRDSMGVNVALYRVTRRYRRNSRRRRGEKLHKIPIDYAAVGTVAEKIFLQKITPE